MHHLNVEIVDPQKLFKFDYPSIANLGHGDQAVIFHAMQTSSLVISDDKKVRKFCQTHKIPVIGTLRLLKNAYQQHYFESKTEYLSIIDFIAQDLYLSDDLINWAKDV